MKVYKGFTASPGLVLGQVSRLDRPPLVFGEGPFHPEQEKQALEDAIKVAQQELDEMAGRAAPSEQAIFLFQSMMLEDEGFMNEVAFQIKAGVGAAEAMDRVGRRYAAQLAAMKDNAYMQLRSVDILDVTQRITNILCHRLRSWQALDHPVILASDLLMPTDLFSVPAGRILGLITAEGSGQSHAAIIARSLNIPGITQVGEEFLKDCDGREVILNATEGECILDPDAAARQSAITCICEMQRQNEELNAQLELPNRTRDGEEFELLANCFGPEDVGTAMESGASGVGLLRSSYMMMPGHAMDEQEQYLFYTSCLAAARGRMVTVRTFDFGADRTMADAYQGVQSSKLGLRGIRSSLRNLPQMAVQICALMRAATKGPLRVMFPMVTSVWEVREAKKYCEEVKRDLKAEGIPFAEDVQVGIMIETPAAAIMSDRLAKEVDFFSCGTNDLTQYTLACDRQNNDLGRFYDPHNPAVLRLLKMVTENAHKNGIWVGICGELGADLTLTETFLAIGVDELSVSPRAVLPLRNAVRMTDTRESAPRLLAAIDAEYPETL